jgi:serine/threonine-protein kinase RsbW
LELATSIDPGMDSQETTSAPGFRITLAGVATNVAIVRQALAGAAGVVGIDEARLLDVNAAVSEACNNVVVHAYPEASGPMVVDCRIGTGELEVTVSDQGVGIRPHRPAPGLELEGLGLSLIQTLTDRVELLGGVGEGTRVQMAFHLEAAGPESWMSSGPSSHRLVDPPPGEVEIAVSAGPLAAPVLGRVIAMLATRSGFSLERISDAQLVTDSLAARIPGVSPGGEVRIGVDLHDSAVLIEAGPLSQGGAQELLGNPVLDGMPPVLERLTGDRRVERSADGETLRLTLVNPR